MKVLLVFAHPDDETFTCGGTVVKLVKQGHKVSSICATKGEAGEVGNPPLCTKDKLGLVRERELQNAAKVLGILKIYFLGYSDGGLEKIKTNELSKKIYEILKKENPDIVITFDKMGGSNHPDHKAISKATALSFEEFSKKANKNIRLYHTVNSASNLKKFEKAGFEYNAFGKMKGTKDEDITTRVNIRKEFNIKVKALKCHETQRQDWEKFLKRKSIANLNIEYFQLISENNLT